MSLSVDVAVRRPGFDLEATFEVASGQVVAVAGPNGAGKTTLLRAITGLERVERGRVVVGDITVFDSSAGIDLETERRGVGMVFQGYWLFPHMTVAENVAFAARGPAGRWIEGLGLGDLADRYPSELSGGEAQRAALARALAAAPRALLLDEPLAALDVETRRQVRSELARHLAAVDVPVVLVTHDPLDAALLADWMLILENGRVTHSGTLTEVTRRPRTPWAARLAGVNLYRGEGIGKGIVIEGVMLAVPEPVDGPALAAIAPSAVALHEERPAGSPRNVWRGEVVGIEPAGSRLRVSVRGDLDIVAEVTTEAAETLRLRESAEVWVAVKASEIETYPA